MAFALLAEVTAPGEGRGEERGEPGEALGRRRWWRWRRRSRRWWWSTGGGGG